MGRLKFEEKNLSWIVKEDGIGTDRVKFETIGLIPKDKEAPCIKIDDDFSGILDLKTMKKIVQFMEGMENEKKE